MEGSRTNETTVIFIKNHTNVHSQSKSFFFWNFLNIVTNNGVIIILRIIWKPPVRSYYLSFPIYVFEIFIFILSRFVGRLPDDDDGPTCWGDVTVGDVGQVTRRK